MGNLEMLELFSDVSGHLQNYEYSTHRFFPVYGLEEPH